MIYVFIEHFLLPIGVDKFSNWIYSVKYQLTSFPGFIDIQQISDVENESRNLILLRFDTLENLRNWASSDTHQQCLDQLKPFMYQKQKSQLFSTEVFSTIQTHHQ